MRRDIAVLSDGAFNGSDRFDLFISVLGYEHRSSHLARSYPELAYRRVALVFPQEAYASYEFNQAALTKLRYSMIAVGSSAAEKLSAVIGEIHEATPPRALRLAVDISSMSRPLIALVVQWLQSVPIERDVHVTFVYCPAVYVEPSDDRAPVAVSEPVTPHFAGWTIAPELPVTAVLGLGYEFSLALGALEFLEPVAAWAFSPTGEDVRYDKAVKRANEVLNTNLLPSRTYIYNVREPFDCYIRLESLIYGLAQHSRPVLVPFGPKIFALLALLVASIHSPRIAVWRVSGEAVARSGDRVASGAEIALHTEFVISHSKVSDDEFLSQAPVFSEA